MTGRGWVPSAAERTVLRLRLGWVWVPTTGLAHQDDCGQLNRLPRRADRHGHTEFRTMPRTDCLKALTEGLPNGPEPAMPVCHHCAWPRKPKPKHRGRFQRTRLRPINWKTARARVRREASSAEERDRLLAVLDRLRAEEREPAGL
jgi:hypothetical protein